MTDESDKKGRVGSERRESRLIAAVAVAESSSVFPLTIGTAEDNTAFSERMDFLAVVDADVAFAAVIEGGLVGRGPDVIGTIVVVVRHGRPSTG